MKVQFENRKNTLIVLSGIPASGKSTFCSYLQANGMLVVSSDAIRKELFGDESIQKAPNKVFKIAYDHMQENGSKKFDCAFDATNLTTALRKKVISAMRPYYDFILCYYFQPNLAECLERNSKRDRKVPDKVIESMVQKFEIPTTEEGFDYVCKIRD